MPLPQVSLGTVRLPHGLSLTADEWAEKQRRLEAFLRELFAPPAAAAPAAPCGTPPRGATLSVYGKWQLDDVPSSGDTPDGAAVAAAAAAGPCAPVAHLNGDTPKDPELPLCDCHPPPVLFENDPNGCGALVYPRWFPIELGPSKIHGKGVFARKRFVDKEVVEVCPVLEIHSRHVGGIMEDYVFCGDRKGWRCVVLGYGMMYNSWIQANLAYYRDEEGNFVYVATRDIEKGEELLIDYGDDWWQSRDKPSVESTVLNWDRASKPETKAERKKPKETPPKPGTGQVGDRLLKKPKPKGGAKGGRKPRKKGEAPAAADPKYSPAPP
eukprot:EG_transcript_16673